MATYLVTGGCGFIGSHLVASLKKDGHRVRVLDNLSTGKLANLVPDCEVVVGDIRDPLLVKSCLRDEISGCFHLAAIASVQSSIDDWAGTNAVNLVGTINILDAARSARASVVLASSAAVYGTPKSLPIEEDHRTSPLSPYGADKLASELHASVAAKLFEMPVTALRFFNVFGPRQNPDSEYSGVITKFIRNSLLDRNITIFGDGTQQRDFIYVEDVVRYLRASMDSCSNFRVANVCTGIGTTLLELVDVLRSVTKKNIKIDYQPSRAGDIHTSIGSPETAKNMLGVEPRTGLREGLAYTVQDFLTSQVEG